MPFSGYEAWWRQATSSAARGSVFIPGYVTYIFVILGQRDTYDEVRSRCEDLRRAVNCNGEFWDCDKMRDVRGVSRPHRLGSKAQVLCFSFRRFTYTYIVSGYTTFYRVSTNLRAIRCLEYAEVVLWVDVLSNDKQAETTSPCWILCRDIVMSHFIREVPWMIETCWMYWTSRALHISYMLPYCGEARETPPSAPRPMSKPPEPSSTQLSQLASVGSSTRVLQALYLSALTS